MKNGNHKNREPQKPVVERCGECGHVSHSKFDAKKHRGLHAY